MSQKSMLLNLATGVLLLLCLHPYGGRPYHGTGPGRS